MAGILVGVRETGGRFVVGLAEQVGDGGAAEHLFHRSDGGVQSAVQGAEGTLVGAQAGGALVDPAGGIDGTDDVPNSQLVGRLVQGESAA
jgi:hypothetical protein